MENTLFQLLGYPAGKEIPFAHYRYQLEFGVSPAQPVLCADPVTMQSGIDQVLLQAGLPPLTAQQTSSVLEVLNRHLAEDGLQLLSKHPQRWYLQRMAGAEGQPGFPLQTTPLSQALGQSIFPLLPQGNHHYWHRLLNELQMLLYRCEPKNANAIWLWGGGDAGGGSAGDPHTFPSTIVGGGINGQTAACAANIPWQAAESFADLSLETGGHHLVVLDGLLPPSLTDQFNDWQARLEALDSAWFLPARNGLNAGRFSVSLSACDGRALHCQAATRWKFWQPQTARWDQFI